ncbi:AAA family ATPase [Pseudohaliea rubra]|uniref:Putative regulatory prophage protein n=1 Tax=Pseudohaliea rubra DSM 19751 TaxID=1265313 RepID=A0A095XXC1_9GAMM|nr:AAA family ATPase [Pseudohaliea rubra]KGE04366.1 putative regulatory prophage protein [Pseudohaliea rubra DSM 19751]
MKVSSNKSNYQQYLRHGIQRENIPLILQRINRWVVWKALTFKPCGKFDKVPVNTYNGRKINSLDPDNWLSFEEAYEAYAKNLCDGIGLVLSGDPVTTDEHGRPLHLVGVDLDQIDRNMSEAKAIRDSIGSYSELSPSLKGARVFALTREHIRGGNAGDGRELYGSKRFLTVTGIRGKGKIIDATEILVQLEKEWFHGKHHESNVVSLKPSLMDRCAAKHGGTVNNRLMGRDWSETKENIARIKQALAVVPPDLPYDGWRDILWSVSSLDWECGRKLLLDWSKGSDKHWESEGGAEEAETALQHVLSSFDPSRGISIGTLFHHARENGWQPPGSAESQPMLATQTQREEKPSERFQLLTPEQLRALPPMDWLVKGLLPSQGVAAIYGAPGSGKTFVALDLALTLSEGVGNWFELKCKQAFVTYIALEGHAGIAKRVAAWASHNNNAPVEARFVLSALDLRRPEHVSALVDAIPQSEGVPAAIFIDTLNQAAPGADENSSSDMGLLMAAANRISRDIGALVILVHHTGKDADRGLRGHSSMNAAVDTAILVEKKNAVRRWRVTKSKDGDGDIEHWFDLKVCSVGSDSDGLPETSCVVQSISAAETVKKPKGTNQLKIWEAIKAELVLVDRLPCDRALEIAKCSLHNIESRQRSGRAKQTLDGLVAGGHLKRNDGRVYLP